VSSSADNTFSPRVHCRFETSGNAIVSYEATTGGRLEATANYAWNGTDGIEELAVNAVNTEIDVGATVQCVQRITVNRLEDKKYSLNIFGNGGKLEIALNENLELPLDRVAFKDSVSLQKHGTATLTLSGAAVASCGDVTVTNGVLEFASDASWLNGTNITVSGAGTLKISAAKTFSRDHAIVRFADNGKIEVPTGVTQVFAEGWDGDMVMAGTYRTGECSRVTGGGAIRIGRMGLIVTFK
jgi:hypothetical protein